MLSTVEGAAGACFVELRAQILDLRNTARVRHLLPARFTVLLRAPVPHATMRTFLSHFLLRGMAALEQTTLMTCLLNGENAVRADRSG